MSFLYADALRLNAIVEKIDLEFETAEYILAANDYDENQQLWYELITPMLKEELLTLLTPKGGYPLARAMDRCLEQLVLNPVVTLLNRIQQEDLDRPQGIRQRIDEFIQSVNQQINVVQATQLIQQSPFKKELEDGSTPPKTGFTKEYTLAFRYETCDDQQTIREELERSLVSYQKELFVQLLQGDSTASQKIYQAKILTEVVQAQWQKNRETHRMNWLKKFFDEQLAQGNNPIEAAMMYVRESDATKEQLEQDAIETLQLLELDQLFEEKEEPVEEENHYLYYQSLIEIV